MTVRIPHSHQHMVGVISLSLSLSVCMQKAFTHWASLVNFGSQKELTTCLLLKFYFITTN